MSQAPNSRGVAAYRRIQSSVNDFAECMSELRVQAALSKPVKPENICILFGSGTGSSEAEVGAQLLTEGVSPMQAVCTSGHRKQQPNTGCCHVPQGLAEMHAYRKDLRIAQVE